MSEELLEQLEESELSFLELLDHVLARGLVIAGEITIAVADVELIFMGLNVVLTSVETAREVIGEREARMRGVAPRALSAIEDKSETG